MNSNQTIPNGEPERKKTFKRSRSGVRAVDGVPLHGDDVEVGAVHVERVTHVVSYPLVDEPEIKVLIVKYMI
jgi:hypothetical protein